MSQNGLVDGLVDEDHHLVDIDVLVEGLNADFVDGFDSLVDGLVDSLNYGFIDCLIDGFIDCLLDGLVDVYCMVDGDAILGRTEQQPQTEGVHHQGDLPTSSTLQGRM